MGTDHRQDYSILRLYLVGARMHDDYSRDDAVEDFVRMHPDADPAEVRAELDREMAKELAAS
jgi:hypothetical protein